MAATRCSLAAAVCLLCSAVLSGAPPFTIEHALSSPFPSSLVASQKGKVAWVLNNAGVRNVWVAEAPAWSGRQLTHYTDDDGGDITQVAWTTDATQLVFTRGEGPNGAGEFPNPRNLVEGTDQKVYAVLLSSGEPHELGSGHSPAISPDGHSVAFLYKDQVWSVPLDGSAKAAQLIHARGSATDLVWAPDGHALAFTSQRAQHSFIAVYTPGQASLRYLDPSVDLDGYAAWSMDSKSIAFIRTASSPIGFSFGAHRTQEAPWSIRVADAFTGKGRELWHALVGPGSVFHELGAGHQLEWTGDGRVIFPWERTGFQRLYITGGNDAVLLTPGANFEVDEMKLSADGRTIFFASNQDDLDRRHIWKVSASGGEPKRVTPGSGIEWSPAPVGDELALLRSTATEPAHAALLSKPLTPSTFNTQAFTEPHAVVFAAADGMQIHGQLFMPNDGRSRHPAVIFIHGGSRRQMLLGWHPRSYYHQAYAFNQYLAAKGFIVLSVNYRSGTGYGLNFREALNYGATGGSEYSDIIGAGLYLRGRGDVLPDKIGLWGGSYGGYLTALALARASDLFACGVDLHGVHEWNNETDNLTPDYEPAKRQEWARIARLSSPIAYVDTWKSPVLLIHGDDDRNVNFRETILLAEALRKQHVPFEQLIFPDEVHEFLTREHWLEAFHTADDFLTRYLMPQ